MSRFARTYVALLLTSAACGDDGEAAPVMAPNGMGMESAPVVSADAGGTPAAPASQGTNDPAPIPDAAAPATADASPAAPAVDAGPKPDAARPPLVLEVPKASVPCGSAPCDTSVDNVCCESWSLDKGFGSSRTCVTRDKCYDTYERAGEQNRAIPHECDGKEDCSGGQVCCMVADGQPLCSLDDVFNGMCISKVYGPGGSGICTDDKLCMLGSTQFVAAGVPLGVLACNDDSDCADRKGTTCQPEQDGSITAGRGAKGRSYVKVCR
jgi:hypothetical protein